MLGYHMICDPSDSEFTYHSNQWDKRTRRMTEEKTGYGVHE